MEIINNSVKCPACGSPMVLKSSHKFTYNDGSPRKFYGCSRFPDCREAIGAAPNGQPLGIPLTEEGRKLRREVHKLCEVIWGAWETADKRAQYAWMRKHAPKTHIGEMNEAELRKTIVLLQNETITRSARGEL